ncbi:MAG: flavodoxin family protein [Methanomicrobiales archaeon]|nr:flavodoxin family protein [Methanomicrobiales archaeon]
MTMPEIRVLGISGSPRRHGNTETLLDALLEGSREAGGATEKVVLRELTYSPCRGCNACHRDGHCIVKDDLTDLFERILGTDCLAIASPIYSMGITAELKGLIDRAQFLWARKFILRSLYFSEEHIRSHKGIFVSTAGLGYEHVFDAAFPAITAFFNTIGFEYWDNMIANDMDKYGGIRKHPTALVEAHEKGRKVVGAIERIRKKAGS